MSRSFLLLCLMTLLIASLAPAAAHSAGDTVQFEWLGHLLLVRAAINGSEEEYNFVVDTGGVALIDKSLAESLNLKQQGPMAKIDSLDLSGFKIYKVFCFTTFDFGLFDALGRPIHGIIGSNLMDRYRMTFDFEAGTLTFSSDSTSLEVPEGGMLLPFKNHMVNTAPMVDFEICGKTLKGMIDTGQPYPVVLPMSSFEKHRDSCAVDYIRSEGLMEEWPMTNPEHNYIARLASFELGNVRLDSAICLFADLPPTLSMPLIGNDLLSQFKMVIDYPSDQMLLIPNEDARFKQNVYSAGLRPDLSPEDEVVVKGIWEGSPADEAGIKVGDRILSFNGHEMTSANVIDLINLSRDDEVDSISIKILQGDVSREVRLKKALLF